MSVRADVEEWVDALAPGVFVRPGEIPGPRKAVDAALSRIAAETGLVCVAHGLYWKGVESRFGPGRPDPLAVALMVAGPGSGPAGWSAARALGITTQLPARPEVAVAGPVPDFARAHFHSRHNLERRDLRPLEVALLEVLRSWPTTAEGRWSDLVGRVAMVVDDREIDLEHTGHVVTGERHPALRERFAALMNDASRGA